MQRSYAVTWQENGGAFHSGKLELNGSGVVLEGGAQNGSGPIVLPYSELLGMGVARNSERMTGRPTLLLYRRGGNPIRIASVVASSIISEVAEHLASHLVGAGPAESRLMVVVPLKEGARDQVAELLEKGPPFEPGEVGLTRHLTFLTDREAIFLFESETTLSLDLIMAETNMWASAVAWRPFIAGAPRIAEPSYSWTKGPEVPEAEGLSFESDPGPGDSEGGNLYAP
jgi:hypothetical protein